MFISLSDNLYLQRFIGNNGQDFSLSSKREIQLVGWKIFVNVYKARKINIFLLEGIKKNKSCFA